MLKSISVIFAFNHFIKKIEIMEVDKTYNHQKSTTANLTPTRAMLLYLFNEYEKVDDSLNLLATQKLAYFLQRFGEPLKLNYMKGWYGPYAPILNKVLQTMNGTFLKYPTQQDSPDTRIRIMETTPARVAVKFEELTPEQKARIALTRQFIEGFETPFSLELLATVDWIIQHNEQATLASIQDEINNWTKRKSEIIKPYHVKVAYGQLIEYQKYLYAN